MNCACLGFERVNDGHASHVPELTEVLSRLHTRHLPLEPGLGLRHVLVPLDFTQGSLQALPYAALLNRQFACEVTLLYVAHLNIVGEDRGIPLTQILREMKSRAERSLQEIASFSNLSPVRILVRTGEPASVILQEASRSRAELIILGRRQRKGFRRLLGPSVSRRIIGRGPCPILVVPC